jgi:hypothetical protein
MTTLLELHRELVRALDHAEAALARLRLALGEGAAQGVQEARERPTAGPGPTHYQRTPSRLPGAPEQARRGRDDPDLLMPTNRTRVGRQPIRGRIRGSWGGIFLCKGQTRACKP